ncbi:MAG: hypothetical protein ABSF26_20410, partial [Thermoguttaceae bacterium]|jgi:hypothetical protein
LNDVTNNEFWGSAPLLMSGVERCRFESNRLVAQSLTGGNSKEPQPVAAIQGTIAEFNLVRDAATCYHVGQSADTTLLRRNHAYAWDVVRPGGEPSVAFKIDREQATAVLELNTTEGREGVWNTSELVPALRGGKRLPKEEERF